MERTSSPGLFPAFLEVYALSTKHAVVGTHEGIRHGPAGAYLHLPDFFQYVALRVHGNKSESEYENPKITRFSRTNTVKTTQASLL
jgi:hypothetical protein